MAYRVVRQVEAGPVEGKSTPVLAAAPAGKEGKEGGAGAGTGAGANVNANGGLRKMDEDEERDAVFYRLEMLGYRVGQGLVER